MTRNYKVKMLSDMTDNQRKKLFVFKKLLPESDYSCSICGRDIASQNIFVFKKNKIGGICVCICQLYKHLKLHNKIWLNKKDWDWQGELKGSVFDSNLYGDNQFGGKK